MPVVAISVKRLNELLGQSYDLEELVTALEQLGCDVEDTVELALYTCPFCEAPVEKLDREEPPKRCDFCGGESEMPFDRLATDRAIRLELLAARPDLFDPGGLARALKGYLGLEQGLPEYFVKQGSVVLNVDPAVLRPESYRPFIVCAVVTMPPLDHNGLREIMKLQENLHWGIGRDRKLASIGVYDLATITPPITYKTVDPVAFSFTPLGMPGQPMSPAAILEHHPKGTAYAHLLLGLQNYPILIDSKGQVLSMPPIINSEETKVKLGSERLFIDVTGLTRDAVTKSLNTLVCSLVELGGQVESVLMNYPEGPARTPDLSPHTIRIKFEEAQKWLGLDFTPEEFMGYLRKMRFSVTPRDSAYEVGFPAFRTDIKHEVDIFEDLAIGYGFHRIPLHLVPTMTIGEARKEELLSQTVREIMIGLGFTEIMSLNLQSEERHFHKFRMEPGEQHALVANPKTVDQSMVRTHLMTGVMETFHKNRRKAVPQKIFELGNVILLNPKKETGAEEYRHLVFAIIGPETGYAEVRSILDSVLREIGRKGEYQAESHPAFCEGRCARVTGTNGLWALLGEIHPEVLNNFGLAYPVALCEVRLGQVI
ncbi:MAG: phenylalanine--tRNA ligase subunit beta [candidate division KSB1 bacterium]|nr:phenylalanine--tRNA ligase subunit beta [candidate division KSB1 bacterium]